MRFSCSGDGVKARNLVLAGFMGTGKSTVGQLVAARLGLSFVDTDIVVEQRAGMSIPALFAESESLFREYEAEVCRQLAHSCSQVIATGGGALLNPETRAALAESGVLICLHAPLETIVARISESEQRPLATSQEKLAALYAARLPTYNALPHHVNTDVKSPRQVADEVIEIWQQHK